MKYLLVSAAAVMAITGAAAIGNAQMQDKGQGPGASSPGAGGAGGAGGGAERMQGGGGGAERAPSGGGSERAQQPSRGQDQPGKGAQTNGGKGEPKAAQQRESQPKSTQEGAQTDKGDKMDRKSATDTQRDKDQKRAADQPQQDQKKAADERRQMDKDKRATDQQRQQDQKKSADQQRQMNKDKKAADQQQRQQDQRKAADQQRQMDKDKKAADQRQPGDRKAAEGGDQKRVQVSEQQRTTVREQIVRDRNIQRVERSRLNVDVRVGVAIPRSVRLHTLPVTLVSTVPAYRGYSYIALEDDTICVVDPRTYVVVDVIEGRGGLRAERSGGARLTLSQEDTRFIYQTLPKERSANVRVRLALGAEVPRDVELIDFPADVVERVPDVRRYRYVVVEDEVVIVDPNDNQVALVINEQ